MLKRLTKVRCVVEFEPKTASVFDGLIACEARGSPEGLV